MKKKIVLLSALGLAGGLLYAFGSQQKRNKSESEKTADGGSGDGRSDTDSGLEEIGTQQSKPAGSMAKLETGRAQSSNEGEHALDDQGTDQAEASHILRGIRDNVFDASDEKLALALGRPAEEIQEWTGGNGLIDGDLLLKARTLAMQRGFEI
jgi:hypothetical protein